MKILLINPWITDFKLYDEWMHPVGLYFVISTLIKNGHDVRYINCLERDNNKKRFHTGTFKSEILETPKIFKNISRHYRRYGITSTELAERLKEEKTSDLIMLTSGMTYWLDGLIECYKIIKEILPDKKIIVGGISAELIPDILKKRLPDVKIYNSQNQILLKGLIKNKLSANISLLPALKLTDNLKHGPVITTLGCPHKCSYCASSILQKKFTRRPLSIILDEIVYLSKQRGIINFSFYDDALLFKPKDLFIPLANKILEMNINLNYHAQNGLHIKWINDKIANLMMSIGFKTLRFGFESGDKSHHRSIDFKVKKNEIINKVRILKSAGFPGKNIGIYVMAGIPNQSPKSLYEDIDFIFSLGVKAKPVFISPVPGTSAYQYYSKLYPEIIDDPRRQNDIYFLTQVSKWNNGCIDKIKKKISTNNMKTEI